MSRSVWKGPFVDPSLLKKVEKLKGQTNTAPIKTWSRKSTIIPEFVGHSFLIYNGKKFSGHTPADKKAAQEAAAASTVKAEKPKEGSGNAKK